MATLQLEIFALRFRTRVSENNEGYMHPKKVDRIVKTAKHEEKNTFIPVPCGRDRANIFCYEIWLGDDRRRGGETEIIRSYSRCFRPQEGVKAWKSRARLRIPCMRVEWKHLGPELDQSGPSAKFLFSEKLSLN